MTTNVNIVAQMPGVATASYDLAISMGFIEGYAWVNKFGSNPASAIDVQEEVWDGSAAYVYPTAALMVEVSQTTDQVALREGIIEVQGLDSNWELVVQTVGLDASNTTTPVVLGTPLVRCFRMKVLANVVCDSSIRCHNAAETQDYAIISAGNNQTLMAVYTIPANKTALLCCYYGDVVENVADGKDPDATLFKLWAADRANNYEFQLKHQRGIPKGSSGFTHSFEPHYRFNEKTDLKITSTCTNRAGQVNAGFDLVVVDN